LEISAGMDSQRRARRSIVQGHSRADTASLLGLSLWLSISTFYYLIFLSASNLPFQCQCRNTYL
jgi:hypothetical protein